VAFGKWWGLRERSPYWQDIGYARARSLWFMAWEAALETVM
jgi:hypothetical protein